MAVDRSPKPFLSGETVLCRGPFVDESGLSGSPEVCDVKPVIVVEDTTDLLAVWLPAGTPTKSCRGTIPGQRLPWRRGEWELVDSDWGWCSALILMFPQEWRAIWVLYAPPSAPQRTRNHPSRALPGQRTVREMLSPVGPGEFMGWYVNLQEPIRRTKFGFDVRDLQLDLIVDRDFRSSWKDEDELDRSESSGVISPPIAQRTRDEAMAVERLVDSRAWPFSYDWASWTPDASWQIPRLPADRIAMSDVLRDLAEW